MLLAALLAASACTSDDDDDAGPGPAPSTSKVRIEELRASLTEAPVGALVTLTWRTRAAASCSLAPGFGTVPRSGSLTVTLEKTTLFTLTCAGGGATASEDVTVQALGVPDAGVPDDGGSDDDGGTVDGGPPPPPFVLEGAIALGAPAESFDELTDDTQLWLIPEREDVTLDDDLPCDIHFPTGYDGDFGSDEPTCTVPAGTRVDSYLLHAFTSDGESTTPSGTVQFAREIVALQWRSHALAAGDEALARPGLVYADPGVRDFGIGFSDSVTFEPDRRTLTLAVNANNIDDLRVITLAEGEAPPLVLSTTLTPYEQVQSLVTGDLESSSDAVFLHEQQGALEAALAVDVTTPGRYTDPDALSPGTVDTDTEVQSALVHFDPPAVDAGTVELVLTATLPTPVLGLVVTSANLHASDAVVGLSDTTYPTGDSRHIELSETSDVWLAEDGRSLRLRVSAGASGIDQLRVLYEP